MEEDVVKCFGIRCCGSRNLLCHVIPAAKCDDENRFGASLAVTDKLILKSDQEGALVSLVIGPLKVSKHTVEDLASLSMEHSQRYDRHASGGTEVGVRL